MKAHKYYDALKKRNLSDTMINIAVEDITALEKYLNARKVLLDKACPLDIKNYIKVLTHTNKNTYERLVNIQRYYEMIENKEIVQYFNGLFKGISVFNTSNLNTHNFIERDNTDES